MKVNRQIRTDTLTNGQNLVDRRDSAHFERPTDRGEKFVLSVINLCNRSVLLCSTNTLKKGILKLETCRIFLKIIKKIADHEWQSNGLKIANNINKESRSQIYAFIDSQNLNLGTSKDLFNNNKKRIYKGWKLDFKKFRVYLADKFRVSKAFLFVGYIKENEKMYRQLRSFDYELIFKPTTKDGFGKPKGNIDAELVLHSAVLEFNNYDKAVIVSGDGDFRCLYEYLIGKKKLLRIIIPNLKAQSSLLKDFQSYKTFLEYEKQKLEYKK